MTILPLTYLGNVEYFGRLIREESVIDLHEHYVKQSYRNRCEIMTANGVTSLTVHVKGGGSSRKRAVCDMRIDNAKKWRQQHWRAIVSAYGNSPYFEHYAGRFEEFYDREQHWLSELNIGLLELTLKLLKLPVRVRYSDCYVECGPNDTDLRPQFKPSKLRTFEPRVFRGYEQVFSDRQAFVPNLSIIDLLFCEGPSAPDFL